jgi:hypothetical protein
MLDAGMKREMGVIVSLKKNEYGFLKVATRKEELYFRVDDIYEAAGRSVDEVNALGQSVTQVLAVHTATTLVCCCYFSHGCLIVDIAAFFK